MPIKWNNNKKRFNPKIILEAINKERTVSQDGKISFNFLVEEHFATLQSMLIFPKIEEHIDIPLLIWRSLANTSEITPELFLESINKNLSLLLDKRVEKFNILTSISISTRILPPSIQLNGVVIKFYRHRFPKKYKSRETIIEKHRLPVSDINNNHCKVVLTTEAKSASSATAKSLYTLDIIRALWCLMSNPAMQMGGKSWLPINVIRLGAIQTAHKKNGNPASHTVWFTPKHDETEAYLFKNHQEVNKLLKWQLQQLAKIKYKSALTNSLVRYVRAFDEGDQDLALVRLWGAIEALASPEIAQYDNIVKRCSFLFQNTTYHAQVLEHLREYRNNLIHSGHNNTNAKIHCFQLQQYFSALIDFHFNNAKNFESLASANEFLDLPPNLEELSRRRELISKALKFIIPEKE